MKTRLRMYKTGTGGWKSIRRICATVLVTGALVGCGGSSDSTPPGDGGGGVIGTGYSGTASTERRLANNSVEIRSQSGTRVSAPIDGNGRFSADTDTDDTGPFLSRIDLGNSEFLYGIGYNDVQGDVQHNIHGYSDLIVRNWFSVRGENIDTVFSDNSPVILPSQADIDAIKSQLIALLELVLMEFGVNGDTLLTADFSADDTGIDAFLDANPVLVNNGTINIVINQNTTNVQTSPVQDLPLDTDLAEADTLAPSIPADVRALAASASEIVIVWTPSTDNVGVFGYRVFRDGTDIGQTAYPVFTDKNLGAGAVHNYTVVAVDGAGNTSAESMSATAQTSGDVDNIPPSAPLALAINTVTNSSISLSWQHMDVSDVVAFEVSGGSTGAANLLAVTSATFVTDTGLDAGIEYCYTVVAVDAAGNKSPASEPRCDTTSGSTIEPPAQEDNVISLANENLQVLDSSGKITITVNRSGSAGEASVNYSVTEGTATEGQDYTATSGTLTWADGITASQMFDIQIVKDTEAESDETFTVNLSAPGNAQLGVISTATVTIINSEPLACDNEPENLVVTENTVLSLPCYVVSGTLDVRSPANLTIQPGVELRFASGGGVIIREGGSLTAAGTQSQGIVMTGVEEIEGFWNGVRFLSSNSTQNRLEHVTIEYGGSSSNDDANLASSNSRLRVSNTILRFSQKYGFSFGAGTLLDAFQDNTVTANEITGLSSPISAAGIAAGNTLTGNTADIVEISNIVVDEATRWADIGVPWNPQNLDVRAPFVIDEGNELQFLSGGWVLVRDTGAFAVNGTTAAPVLLTGTTQTPGWWRGVEYSGSTSVENAMSFVTIEYGGADSDDANLSIDGNSRFKGNNLTLRDSLLHGFYFGAQADVSEFSNVVSTANQSPASVATDLAGSIGPGASFTGNASNFVTVRPTVLNQAQTWLTHDVPYVVDGLDVRADLTMSPGTTVIVKTGKSILVRNTGSFNAVGTAAAPIMFTGEQMIPGSWEGIQYSSSISARNVLDFTVVEYGGSSAAGGNIDASCNSATIPAVTVSNSNLDNSAGWGIFVSGSCSVDIAGGVTFMGNAAGEVNVLAP